MFLVSQARYLPRRLILLGIASLLVLGGCGTAPTKTAVDKFATAMGTTATTVETGFSTVNTAVARYEVGNNKRKYLK